MDMSIWQMFPEVLSQMEHCSCPLVQISMCLSILCYAIMIQHGILDCDYFFFNYLIPCSIITCFLTHVAGTVCLSGRNLAMGSWIMEGCWSLAVSQLDSHTVAIFL